MPHKLAFKVTHASGQDDVCRASELNYHSPLTKGWQAARFCLYPQEIVINFERRSRIKKIQVLSHQTLIATKIEFFVGDVPDGLPVVLENARYTRLGYVSLSDNEKTGFKARELKSVQVDAVGVFLKLNIHKNHINKYNLYNQVGLVAVNVIGDEVRRPLDEIDDLDIYGERRKAVENDPALEGLFTRPDYISPLDDLAFDMYQDPEIAQIIRKLERKKQEAVLQERYDYAKKLKHAIQELQKVGEKLGKYEVEKRQAIENEDYDKAKLKKVQMDEYRLQIYKDIDVQDLLELSGVLATARSELVNAVPDREALQSNEPPATTDTLVPAMQDDNLPSVPPSEPQPETDEDEPPLATPVSLPRRPTSARDTLGTVIDLREDREETVEVTVPISSSTPNPAPNNSAELRLHLDVTDDGIDSDIDRLRQSVTEAAQIVSVRRTDILDDVLNIYRHLDLTVRLHVNFTGELGADLGGLTKDMFACFWTAALERYFCGENSKVPHLPISDRHMARDIFPVLGKVLEHMLKLVGTLPSEVCRSALLWMCSTDRVNEELLLEDYLLYLPEAERNLLSECLQSVTWTETQKRRMLLFNSAHQINVIATPGNIKQILLNAAQLDLLDRPSGFFRYMFGGMSPAGKTFFSDLTPIKVRELYSATEPTQEKVADLVLKTSEEEDLSPIQMAMVNHLYCLVREMDKETLQRFLVWVTGSPAMPRELNIMFNTSRGFAAAPVARTCGNLLELSEDYDSYQDFKRQMLSVINSEEAMRMSIL